MFRSIRTKLLLTYLALAMITVIIAGLLSFLLIIRNARIQERQYLHTVAKNLAGELEQQDLLPDRQQGKTGIPPRQGWRRYGDGMFMRMMTAPDFSPAQGSLETRLSPETKRQIQELADAAGYLHNIQVQLLTPDQKLILRSAQPPLPGRMQEMMRELAEIMDDDARQKGRASNQMLLLPIGSPGQPAGFISISGGPDLTARAAAGARNALIFASLTAIGIALLLGLVMGRKITRPIISLSSAAERMATGDLDARVSTYSANHTPSDRRNRSDEIAELSRLFNLMAENLQTSFETIEKERDTLRAFMQDASHHLRTPVTALTTFNELLQRLHDSPATGTTAAERSEPRRQAAELLADSAGQLERLKWMIDKLLHLTRIDAQVTSIEKRAAELSPLAERAWQSAIHTFASTGEQTNTSPRTTPVLKKQISQVASSILCDEGWMETALGNLFENAVKYGAKTVILAAAKTESGAEITVSDDGPGIGAEELPKIFDRFYRGGRTDSDGTGLGLAIVKSIVEAHDGTITAASEAGKGTGFIITLPEDTPRAY